LIYKGGDQFVHFLGGPMGGAGVGTGYSHGGTNGPRPNGLRRWVSHLMGGGGVDGVVSGTLGGSLGSGGGGGDKGEV
jgi:hypothetical protein